MKQNQHEMFTYRDTGFRLEQATCPDWEQDERDRQQHAAMMDRLHRAQLNLSIVETAGNTGKPSKGGLPR